MLIRKVVGYIILTEELPYKTVEFWAYDCEFCGRRYSELCIDPACCDKALDEWWDKSVPELYNEASKYEQCKWIKTTDGRYIYCLENDMEGYIYCLENDMEDENG